MDTDLGTRLRLARETRGLTLRDIASVTKISMTALTAMERNEFGRLPGGIFRRAYVKAFGAEVGLDADALERELRATVEVEARGPLERAGASWKGLLLWSSMALLLILILGGLLIARA